MIHSHRYTSSEPTTHFWDIQASIVTQLRLILLLPIVLAFVHPDHDSRAVSNGFLQRFHKDGWICSDTVVSYPIFGNSVSGSCHLIAAVHSNTKLSCKPIEFKTPPPTPSRRIRQFLWAPFNRPELAISYLKDDKSFNNHAVNDSGLPPLHASIPTNAQQASLDPDVRHLYYLHRPDVDPSVLIGSAVVSDDGLCPPFQPMENGNLFGRSRVCA
jgi:hypothetical protein